MTLSELQNTEGLVVNLIDRMAQDLLVFFDFRDLVQDCIIAVSKEQHRFDEARGKWSTFVSVVVRTVLSRTRTKCYRLPLSQDPTLPEFSHCPDPHPLPWEGVSREDIASAYLCLDEREKKVVEDFVHKVNQEETAEEWNIHRTRVAQIRKQAFEKIRTTLVR